MQATEKQNDFINDLLEQRQLTEEQYRNARERFGRGLTKDQASAWIERLLALPRKTNGGEELPDVPAGRYAVENDEGRLKFYIVNRPTQGRWSGYTFVDSQHGPNRDSLRNFAQKRGVLQRIVDAGIVACRQRYGQELGHCGACGLELTDPISREVGIGPVCRGRDNYEYGEDL